jgi:hypothetical protein
MERYFDTVEERDEAFAKDQTPHRIKWKDDNNSLSYFYVQIISDPVEQLTRLRNRYKKEMQKMYMDQTAIPSSYERDQCDKLRSGTMYIHSTHTVGIQASNLNGFCRILKMDNVHCKLIHMVEWDFTRTCLKPKRPTAE